jgi:hypothetical protein
MNEKEEIWFDIYRSITSGDSEKDRIREKKLDRRR